MNNNFFEIKLYDKTFSKNSIRYEKQQLPKKVDILIDFQNSQFAKALEIISESGFYKKITSELSYQHKIGHIQKVMLFSQIIAQNENLDRNQTKILLAAAAFHDSGRTRDRDNGEHGIKSAEIAGEYFKKNPNNPYGITRDEIGIIQASIEYHVISDDILGNIDEEKLNILCCKNGVDLNDFEKAKQISAILKDADALDRTRFISGGCLDTRRLRTETAKKEIMIKIANKINQEYATYVLRQNYSNEQFNSNDKVEALHYARSNYKRKNDGVRKEETEIPVEIIKSIFKEVLNDIKMKNEKYASNNKGKKEELEL